MSQSGSIAPKERVNIVYRPATGDAQEEVELPLKLLVVGDFTGRGEEVSGELLEERKPISIDKDTFDEVLRSHNLELRLNVPNQLRSEDEELGVTLRFDRLADFGPEAVVEQVPELKQLLQLRSALTALKGPLGNAPAFRKKLQEMIGNRENRQRLLGEISATAQENGKAEASSTDQNNESDGGSERDPAGA